MANSLLFIEFHVTGVERSGKRFKRVYCNCLYAMSINLWRGSVYGVLECGKRVLLKRVYN